MYGAAVVLLCTILYGSCKQTDPKITMDESSERDSNQYMEQEYPVVGTSGTAADRLVVKEYNGPKKRHESFIGFTAWKQSPQIYEAGEIITFDGIILNEGGHYSPTLNMFTCPTDGVYFVAVTIRGDDTAVVYARVILDSEYMLYLYNSVSQNPWNIVSNCGLIRCSSGQRIWVEGASSIGSAFGEPGVAHSTFTAILMQPGGANVLHEEFVGFTAWKSTSQNYIGGDIITYEETLFNEGQHFIPSVNRFICPHNGTYYVSINSYNSYIIDLGVYQNSLTLLRSKIFVDYFTMLSNNRLIKCYKDDYISVKAAGVGSVYGQSSEQRTTFSAILMHQDAPSLTDDTDLLHSSFIGFSAFKKYNQLYQIGDTIVFDGVLLNSGDHYQPILSQFVCPTNGIYYIALNCKRIYIPGENIDMVVDVEKASITIFRLTAVGTDDLEVTVSNSALVRCFVDEDISVKGVTNGGIHGDTSEELTTFTVMLMYEY